MNSHPRYAEPSTETRTAAPRTIRTETPPPRAAAPAPPRSAWLPREASLKPALALMGALAGFAIAYATAQAGLTRSAYELRNLNRQLAEQKSYAARLEAQKAVLELSPGVLARAVKLGIDTTLPADRVLEARQ